MNISGLVTEQGHGLWVSWTDSEQALRLNYCQDFPPRDGALSSRQQGVLWVCLWLHSRCPQLGPPHTPKAGPWDLSSRVQAQQLGLSACGPSTASSLALHI